MENYYKGCDLFISTYNENYDYFSFSEKMSLIESNKGKSKVELRKDRSSYTRLPKESVEFIKKTFPSPNFEITSEGIFLDWYGNALRAYSNIEFSSLEETFFHYGQLWSKFRGLKLVLDSNKKYDYVIFNRCDIVPTSNSYLNLVNTVKAAQKRNKDKLITHKITVTSGMLQVSNQFFACSFENAIKLYHTFNNSLGELFKNPLFANFKETKTMDTFNLLGLLIQYSQVSVKTSDFLYEQKIRKEHLVRGLDLLDREARSQLRLEENELFAL